GHPSFIGLPDYDYPPRPADPRVVNISIPLTDYAAGLDEPLTRRYAIRHRLQKTNPEAERSPAKKPIIFYVDPGAPDPVRDALIEGASWWAEAFEAAGFEDGYQVKVLPEGAHPLDARYNVINWVHRQTRGWSYGRPIIDPRTGEIVKAVITLGSLRVRHDRRIFEGLLDARRTGTGGPDDPIEIALARLRQLSAHEVGHGLGFVHNMAASADGRASVMDYPAPLVGLAGEGLDFSKAYDTGIGEWDKATVAYVYREMPEGAGGAMALNAMAREARATHLFVADAHARPVSGAHPQGSVWDNGADAVAELKTVLEVRRRALRDFGLDNLPQGAPISQLREVLVPIYLYHRYQMAAAAKAIGGLTFSYGVAGGNDRSGTGADAMAPVPAAQQMAALDTLLTTVTPDHLALPSGLVPLLQPVNINWYMGRYTRDEFRSDAYPVFDGIQAATVAAGLTFDALLNRERLVRMMQFHAREPDLPGIDALFKRIAETVFAPLDGDPHRALLQQAVAGRYVQGLADLADGAPALLAARVRRHMESLKTLIRERTKTRPDDLRADLIGTITRQLERPFEARTTMAPAHRTPPGSPIGASGPMVIGASGPMAMVTCDTCWLCESDL
ncbi:MAG: zinc-dependent metalloprotease, partial [Alphaproteobacteria bacterium]